MRRSASIARGELVDGGPAGQEVLHHLPRDFRRIGRDAARRHAVAAGEHRDARPLDPRAGAALPGGQPFGDLLEPAERARRLGELGLAAHHLGPGREVRSRQVAQDAAHFVESGWDALGVHRGRGPSYIRPIMTSPNDHSQRAYHWRARRPSTTGCRPSRSRRRSSPALKLDVGVPRWQLADVLPVLPFIGAGVGLAAGLVFAIVRGAGRTGLAGRRAGGRRGGR